jgi:NADPH:quinone reductase-like Zn-dependent oxidoreductase
LTARGRGRYQGAVRKVVISRPGGYERLAIVEGPAPTPGPGEVRIAVAAIGVNYADCVVRMGLYASAREFVGWPITPGFEVAGTISAVGEGAAWRVGDEVLAVTRFGGYATEVVVPAAQVFARPPGLALAQAAGLPTIFLTADYAAHALAQPRPGDAVLVHSAAGGVGSALVQLLAARGCRVVGVVGAAHKVGAAQALGAARVIDKSAGDPWAAARAAAPGGFAAVFDANGPATLRASYRHLAPAGRLVVYGFHSMLPRAGGRPNWLALAWHFLRTPWFSPLALTNENRAVMGFNLSYMFHRGDLLAEAMARVLDGFARGALRMPAVTTYPFGQVARAHRDLESGGTVGKLVLAV